MYITIQATITSDIEHGDREELNIVTSFYTSYIIVSNLIKDIPNINVINLTNNEIGCAHDYQLTTDNMKTLSTTDIFIMNGGGIEGYIEEVVNTYPKINIIDLSQNITMLDNTHVHEDIHNHEEEHDHDHDHGEFNPHVWMNPQLYINQIENAQENISDYLDKSNIKKDILEDIKERINSNSVEYVNKIKEVSRELERLNNHSSTGVIIFHDSFAYLADLLDLEVIETFTLEEDTSLSAGEIAYIINIIKEKDIKIVFSESQYSDFIPSKIAEETNAKVFTIDTAVLGDGNLDSYINAMRNNILTIENAFEYEKNN